MPFEIVKNTLEKIPIRKSRGLFPRRDFVKSLVFTMEKRKSRLENPNTPGFFAVHWNIKQIPNPGSSPYGGIPGRDFPRRDFVPGGRREAGERQKAKRHPAGGKA